MIDYRLVAGTGPVSLEIKDSKGAVLRRYASSDPLPTPDPKLKIPRYWVKPPQTLSAEPGLHRFYWDLHVEPLKEVEPDYPMTAVFQKTAPQPTGPWVLPGEYSVVLTAGGKTLTQPLTVKMDPRVKVVPGDLAKQFDLSKALYETRATLLPIGKIFDSLVEQVAKAKERAGEEPIKAKIDAFHQKLEAFGDPAPSRPGQPLHFDVLSKVEQLFGDLQEADAGPTPQVEMAAVALQRDAKSAIERWHAIPAGVEALNAELQSAGIEKLRFP
jgi:hypothetical protein